VIGPSGGKQMPHEELLVEELLAEVESIAPVVAEQVARQNRWAV
jgi:hypothetical protein